VPSSHFASITQSSATRTFCARACARPSPGGLKSKLAMAVLPTA